MLPAVREAEPETLVIADGFSCREQIAQTTSRQGLHLAQVIHLAMQERRDGPSSTYPEAAYLQRMEQQLRGTRSRLKPSLFVGMGLATLLILLNRLIRKQLMRS